MADYTSTSATPVVDQARLNLLKSRIFESDLLDWRGYRVGRLQDWKNRLRVTDKLYAGEWDEVFPDESVMRENPHVMNLVQTGMDDMTKLVTETVPSIVCPPTKDSETASSQAHLREAIASTYWEVNDGDLLTPQFAMDLLGAGAAFAAVYVDKDEDYPCFHRINPRYAYPDVLNGKLLDLMVLESMNIRVAARVFPQLGFTVKPEETNHMVEIMHYYSPEECLQAVLTFPSGSTQPNKAFIVNRWNPHGKLPIAFVQMDSFDGAFRGIFDQVSGSLQTKNRIVKQLLEYADSVVYTPFFEVGVTNPEAIPGPGVVYHGDPNVQGARMERVQPATPNIPAMNFLLEYLDNEQRGGTTYPKSRGGEVNQSIASASFVASTMGSLTSSVRNIQRLIGKLREQLSYLGYFFDEKELNYSKPLFYAIGKKMTYEPERDIGGVYRNRVIYGAGAGLDRMQADVRVQQHVSTGLVSKATGREQIDYIRDPKAEAARIELEATDNVLMQKFLTEADILTVSKLRLLQGEGSSLAEAIAFVMAEQQAQQQQQPAAPAMPGAPGQAPQGQPQAPQQGAAPSGAAVAPQFAPPPVSQVVVSSPSGGRLIEPK